MDEDLETMSREQLIVEIKRLRLGIRTHRDSSGHELCWYHPALWSLVPEPTRPVPIVPTWPEFLRGCVRYRESLAFPLLNTFTNRDYSLGTTRYAKQSAIKAG